ncbi:hypothetical protein LCGC14_0976000 [marine sediment metagenome]|uniref:Uncharacterized protein n=1 Tax=marine sediment metagenome TaxID=412755 RepID=A0A0F9NWG4_9ZZZZ
MKQDVAAQGAEQGDLPVGQGDPPVEEGETLIIPLERGQLRRSKAVRFSDSEVERLDKFQEWLSVTIDPKTGHPYIARNQFGDLVEFCFNVTYIYMAKLAEQMAQAEEAG